MGRDILDIIKMATHQITDGLMNDSSSLCFKKDVFMNESFSVDKFVSEHRKNVSLETLREDLSIYLRVLRSAMIELINQDYADFVNLSSNLAGLDKSINSLCVPLGQLREEVLAVRATFNDALSVAQQHLKNKIEIDKKKVLLQRVMSVLEGISRLEVLCERLYFSPDDQQIIQSAKKTDQNVDHGIGDIVEQTATQLSHVDSHMKKTLPSCFMDNTLQRLEKVRQIFHSHLEQSFLSTLENPSGNKSLHSVLRAAASINHIPTLQDHFLKRIVRPSMMEIISEKGFQQKGLEHIYKEVLDFINQKCSPLLDISYSTESSFEICLVFKFLTEVVWPEVVSCLESRIPFIFSPGNPASFQKNYLVSQVFLQRLYAICPTETVLRQFKETPAHVTFLSKWNLPVYYQIRFQEIAGALEIAFTTPFLELTVGSVFCLNCSQTLYHGMVQCWSREVHLDSLSHRFWKLNLQLVTRYTYWVEQIIGGAQDKNQFESKPSSQEMLNNGSLDGSLTAPSEPEPTTKHLVMLVTDLKTLHSKVPLYFDEIVRPVLCARSFTEIESLKGCLEDCANKLAMLPDKVGQLLVSRLVSQCSAHLKMANEIPRLYRKTNREVPAKASTYIGLVFQPLENFESSQGSHVPKDLWDQWRQNVAEQVTEQYLTVTRDVLHSVKKMEDSLKRLKKVRERTPTSVSTSGAMTDDDKIRVQFAVDVQAFGSKMDSLSIESSSLTNYSQLIEVVESARNTPSS